MLIERPLLQALTQARSPVLLIDELDRADEPFDAFLLEVLAENQLTIPELGTVKAAPDAAPIVVITSNRTREIHDALKRRCLYHWVDYPDVERELEIVRIRAPGAPERLAAQVVAFVQRMRTLDLFKAPGIAETIDWSNALVALNAISLAPDNVRDTLGVLLKHRDDIAKMQSGDVTKLLAELQATARVRRAGRCSLTTSSTSRASCATPALPVGPDRVLAALEAIEAVGLARRDDVHAALSAVMIDRHEQQALFDDAFAAFWRDPKLLERMMAELLPKISGRGDRANKPRSQPPRRRARAAPRRRRRPAARSGPTSAVEFETSFAFSDRERLQRADFESMTAAEFELAKKLAEEVPLPFAPVRRRRHAAERARPRSTCARRCCAMARQPQTLVPRFSRPRSELPTIVVLLDVSGSMDRYARLMLHYVHGLTRRYLKVHTLTFGTRLTNITRGAAPSRPRPRARSWRARRCRTGRAARASPRASTTSTGTGRGACSAPTRRCCSSPTASTATSTAS